MSDQAEIIIAVLSILGSLVSGGVLVWRMVVARRLAAQEHEEELQRKRVEWDIERQRLDDAREKAFEDALMTQTNRAQSMLEESFKRITQLDKERTQAVQDATRHLESLAAAETQITALQSVVDSLKEQNDKQLISIEEARQALLEAAGKIGKLEGVQDELKTQVQNLTTAHIKIQREFSTLLEQKRDLEARNIVLTQERDRLNDAIDDLRKELDELKEKYATLAREHEELKQRYEQDKINPDNNRVAAVPADSVSDMGTIPPHTN